MNDRLKSAIIGGGSIASLIAAFAMFGYFFALIGFSGNPDLGAGFMVILVINVIAGFLSVASWFVSLVDAATSQRVTASERPFWIVVIALFGVFGSLVYWLKFFALDRRF